MIKTKLSTDELKIDQIFTPSLCKAARNLLSWKQEDLARKSEVSLATIGSFETGLKKLKSRTLKDLRATFEQAGIEFDDNDKFCLIKLNK